ncbi:MAG TPA: DUF5700 domain-containing putative Zn-dependent protease, partial [Candidatus Eremiobacteraceae bacterium]|nr:DUF5700 domain-containing putative Zn-dependent protease [Candidatus Eremiobacteraceae bacterium]
WETSTDPAIFLYVDPEVGKAQFDNTVSHELHHIGLASAQAAYNKLAETRPEKVRPLLNWIGAFGEGEAVLAAAGSPDVEPLSAWPEKHRIRWEQDMTGFSSQVSILDEFFLDILHGGFANQETIGHVGSSFFGFRGPWYTVGYKMSVIVEKRFGRESLIECMEDPRKLLARYNEAEVEERKKAGEALPLWSPEVIAALGLNEKETSGGK